jgi:pilus assembly protein Flp/PilA
MLIVARAHMALAKDRSGATAIEYGLIAAGIAVLIIGTVFALGGRLDQTFQDVVDCLTTPASC